MESEIIRKFYKHNFHLSINDKGFNKKSEDTQKHQNPSDDNQLSSFINQIPFHFNKIAREEYIRILLLKQENLTFKSKIYQDYIKTYQKFTSLYYAILSGEDKTKLIIHNTKSHKEQKQVIDLRIEHLAGSQYIAQLPNGDLFCFCNASNYSTTNAFLIDSDFHLHELPSGSNITCSSVIYYNRSVYCFGGHGGTAFWHHCFSSRFDLDKNLWVNLAPIPEHANRCTTAIFNGNILISNSDNVNLWLYSIDIDSFSVIPFKFILKRKVMVNAEDRLYLIQRTGHWCIYESGIWDEFSWKLIAIIENIDTSHGEVYSCIYNKEKESIYIISFEYEKKHHKKRQQTHYWKFNLNEKILKKIERIKKIEKMEKMENVEKIGKVEKIEKIENLEKKKKKNNRKKSCECRIL